MKPFIMDVFFLKKKSAEDNKSMKKYTACKKLFDLIICVQNYFDYWSG